MAVNTQDPPISEQSLFQEGEDNGGKWKALDGPGQTHSWPPAVTLPPIPGLNSSVIVVSASGIPSCLPLTVAGSRAILVTQSLYLLQ